MVIVALQLASFLGGLDLQDSQVQPPTTAIAPMEIYNQKTAGQKSSQHIMPKARSLS